MVIQTCTNIFPSKTFKYNSSFVKFKQKVLCKVANLGLWHFFFLAFCFCFDIQMNTLMLRSQLRSHGDV